MDHLRSYQNAADAFVLASEVPRPPPPYSTLPRNFIAVTPRRNTCAYLSLHIVKLINRLLYITAVAAMLTLLAMVAALNQYNAKKQFWIKFAIDIETPLLQLTSAIGFCTSHQANSLTRMTFYLSGSMFSLLFDSLIAYLNIANSPAYFINALLDLFWIVFASILLFERVELKKGQHNTVHYV